MAEQGGTIVERHRSVNPTQLSDYRVDHLLANLGWVDLDLEYYHVQLCS